MKIFPILLQLVVTPLALKSNVRDTKILFAILSSRGRTFTSSALTINVFTTLPTVYEEQLETKFSRETENVFTLSLSLSLL